jgi:hypothetical protein
MQCYFFLHLQCQRRAIARSLKIALGPNAAQVILTGETSVLDTQAWRLQIWSSFCRASKLS